MGSWNHLPEAASLREWGPWIIHVISILDEIFAKEKCLKMHPYSGLLPNLPQAHSIKVMTCIICLRQLFSSMEAQRSPVINVSPEWIHILLTKTWYMYILNIANHMKGYWIANTNVPTTKYLPLNFCCVVICNDNCTLSIYGKHCAFLIHLLSLWGIGQHSFQNLYHIIERHYL